LYNIAYGGVKDPEWKAMVDDENRKDELEEKVVPASKRAQIHQFIVDKNEKYGERVGERGLKLSGGEK
jgi:ABC-type transport system involved in Fe-S cluster assembly fused permease/ATPase subunit